MNNAAVRRRTKAPFPRRSQGKRSRSSRRDKRIDLLSSDWSAIFIFSNAFFAPEKWNGRKNLSPNFRSPNGHIIWRGSDWNTDYAAYRFEHFGAFFSFKFFICKVFPPFAFFAHLFRATGFIFGTQVESISSTECTAVQTTCVSLISIYLSWKIFNTSKRANDRADPLMKRAKREIFLAQSVLATAGELPLCMTRMCVCFCR